MRSQARPGCTARVSSPGPFLGGLLQAAPLATVSGPRGAVIDFSASSLVANDAIEKKSRHRMTDLQLGRLEALYERTTHPNRTEKQILGNELGMSFKSVNIWFQNKRQTARKKDAAASVPPPATCVETRASPAAPLRPAARHPLATVSHGGNTRSISKPTAGKVAPSELWTYLLSSPASSPGRAHALPQFRLCTPAVSPTLPASTHGVKKAGERTSGVEIGKRQHILEWACAREEKRRRFSGGDEDGDSGLGGSSGSDSNDEINAQDQRDVGGITHSRASRKTGRARLGIADRRPSARAPAPTTAPALSHVLIPPEYTATFSEDVILGASLLLTFKHSMDAA